MWKLQRRQFLGGLGAFTLIDLLGIGNSPEASAQSPKGEKPRVVAYMKDKFAIEGYVKREDAEVEVDNGTPITYPKGLYLLDDGPRRIMFPQTQFDRIDPIKGYTEERIIHTKHFPVATLSRTIPSITQVVDASPFTGYWTRTLKFRGREKTGKLGQWEVEQHIGMLTPYSMRIDTVKLFNFSSSYLTHEFSEAEIVRLLASHPDFEDDKALPAADRVKRVFKAAEFLAQAGFFDNAERMLDRAAKDFPKQKETIEQRQKVVSEIKTREDWEQTKRLALVGQPERVRERLKLISEKSASEEIQAKMRELKTDYDTAEANVKLATTYFKSLQEDLTHADRAIFRSAAKDISSELCIDNVNRLDTFLLQAKQYENLKKDGKKSQVGSAELMSLAMSAWLLGSASGDTKPETALHLWKMRKLVLDYEKTDDSVARQKMVEEATKDADEAAMVEEAAQIASILPPTEPAEIILKTQEGIKVGQNTVYDLQLPPEYRHGRHYPVLIVLHESGEKPRHMLDRWRDGAADNGYLLVAPEWEGRGNGYTYSEREHQIILDTIRDLRRKYRVDSDRVFLFGLREGGAMALDIGMSHPDLFAGVSTMGAGPEKFSEIYWHNAQYLPFYIVDGDRSTMLDKTHTLFEHWVQKSFASLWVSYKGRGSDWFGGEVPTIFEWMRVKRRAFPLTQLGRDGGGSGLGTEFTIERPTDNSFYWLTTDDVQRLCWNSAGNFQVNHAAAQLTATINPETNDIRVQARGLNQVSVWLGRNLRGESMIDFTKPVSFRVGSQQVLNKQKIKPSLMVLLEDLYRRGDRQRAYMAKLDWINRGR